MTKRSTMIGMAIAALMMACGGGQEQAAEPAPEPVVQQAPPCAEQWVHMPMLITFPTSGSTIDHQNREILREMVRSAQARNDIRRVRVEGHTDTCGNELNNMQLSRNRATSVANELVQMGVPRNMIETVGYGSTQPRANESCGRGQQLSEQTNRRVEFSLLVCH
ncbi:MAG TPA: OmpA family protein [Sandaracinaceae bacterium LLY-WYZ-13_1]|nr:OmpA family protein [Sandaracinaceae bacterium LLY-WYZ-13_1]